MQQQKQQLDDTERPTNGDLRSCMRLGQETAPQRAFRPLSVLSALNANPPVFSRWLFSLATTEKWWFDLYRWQCYSQVGSVWAAQAMHMDALIHLIITADELTRIEPEGESSRRNRTLSRICRFHFGRFLNKQNSSQ